VHPLARPDNQHRCDGDRSRTLPLTPAAVERWRQAVTAARTDIHKHPKAGSGLSVASSALD
jgi:hypothetical protein